MVVAVRLDLPAERASIPIAREQSEHLLAQLGVGPETIWRARIIVTEACANVVAHAYTEPGQRYLLELLVQPDRLTISVTDHGLSFDSERIPVPVPGQVGGYGVHLIRQMADAVRFDRPGDRGNRVIAELSLKPARERAARRARTFTSPASTRRATSPGGRVQQRYEVGASSLLEPGTPSAAASC